MNWFRKILHLLLLAILPAVLPVASAMAQVTTIYPGQKVDLSIDTQPVGSTYNWEIYCGLTVDFAKTPGNCTSAQYQFVNGINNQAYVQVIFSQPGTYMAKIEVWDPVTCTNNMKFILLEVEEALPEVVLTGDSVCVGDPAMLTMNLTGTGPWDVTYTNGTDSWTIPGIITSEYKIPIFTTSAGITEFWVTEIKDTYGTNTEPSGKVEVTVYPKPTMSRIYQVDK
jgi:hypothetical protein